MERKNRSVFFDNGIRWKRLKKTVILVLIPLPIIVTLIAFAFLYSPFTTTTKAKQRALAETIEEINDITRPVIDMGPFFTIDETTYDEPYIKRIGEEKKQVVLSFDDGPDPKVTPYILDVLQEHDVHGTFFSVGNQLYKYPEIGRTILQQGSDIGLHTFSHRENIKDENLHPLTFIKELDFSEKIFAHHYGFKTLIFRIPFVGLGDKLSYDALQYIREANARNLTISGPTVDAEDWHIHDPAMITKLATTSDVQTVVILFHDAGGNRDATIRSLPEVIRFYKERGYEFLTVSELAKQYGLPYAEPLSFQDKLFSDIAFTAYDTYKKIPSATTDGFYMGFLFVVLHSNLLLFLALTQNFINPIRTQKRILTYPKHPQSPHVTVLIPVHNEESSIEKTVKAILKSTHKNLDIMVINNGSTDNSVQRARAVKNSRVTVLSTAVQSKNYALNYGLYRSRGKYIVTIDADTIVAPNAIEKLISFFADKNVGGVAGNIEVGNKTNVLARVQVLEYIINQGIEKRAADLFGSVMVVPGAFGAWRKEALRKINGFSSDTLAEDFDATLEIMKNGYSVQFADQAVAYTEVPTKFSSLFKQRIRWNFGNLQVYFKHKSLLFKKDSGAVGHFFLPRAIFIHIPSVILTPIVDFYIITNLLIGERGQTGFYLSLYLLLQIILAAIAYVLSKKLLREFFYIPLLRFPYTQFLYCIFYITLFRAVRGELVQWVKTQHTGKFTIAVD